MFKLFVAPKLTFRAKPDGSGFDLGIAYKDHRANLKIGNVSIAFDGYNTFKGKEGETYSEAYIELSELSDDPVRLHNRSVDEVSDPADKLLYALAADRGYRLEKIK